MPANGRCRSPWVMNDDAGSRSRDRCIEQLPIAEIKTSQALASQMPTGAGALASALIRPGGIALIPQPDLCCLALAVGQRIFKMLIEKIQQQLVGFWPPLQMGGGADVQFGIAAAGLLIAGVFLIVDGSVKLGFAAIGLGLLIALVFPGQKTGVPSVFPTRWGQF